MITRTRKRGSLNPSARGRPLALHHQTLASTIHGEAYRIAEATNTWQLELSESVLGEDGLGHPRAPPEHQGCDETILMCPLRIEEV